MPQSGLLFTYTGDLRIVQVTMGDVYKQKHFVQNKRITDEVQAIESIWSLDTSRYEDYVRVIDQLKQANATRISIAESD